MTDSMMEALARGEMGEPLYQKFCNAIARTNGTHTPADVIRGVADGRYRMMQTEKSVLIAEVIDYPRARAVHVFLAAGNLRDLYSNMLPKLEAYARSVGADRLSACGRHGWARSAQEIGFKPDYSVIVKKLEG